MEPNKALRAVAALCSKKEYCCHDIRQKLVKWELAEPDIRQIMDYLLRQKFIDDRRYAGFYARDKFRFNKWGKLKISQMLQQKGISSDIITEALAVIDEKEDYYTTCLTLLRQKMRSSKETDAYKNKIKLFRFALGRGFDYDTVKRCFDTLQVDSEEW